MTLHQIARRPDPVYSCSSVALYAGLHQVWNSQAQYEADFASDNTQYTPGLAAVRKAAIDAAQEMPDGKAHGAIAAILRVYLLRNHDAVIAAWKALDAYISKAYKGAAYKPKAEIAGKKFYRKAVNMNWEYAKQLLVSGKSFIDAYSAVLIADGGMPVNFAAGYNTLQDQFVELYEAFKMAQQTGQQQTDAKVLANNLIYEEGRTMMKDAKRIFRGHASLRHRFVWARVMEKMSPSKKNGEGM
jgi:hypothetical protein